MVITADHRGEITQVLHVHVIITINGNQDIVINLRSNLILETIILTIERENDKAVILLGSLGSHCSMPNGNEFAGLLG